MKRILQLMLCTVFAFTLQGQSVVWSEDFESGEPSGWFAESGWNFGTATSLSSQYYTIPGGTGNLYATNDDAAGNGVSAAGRLVTSKIDLTGVDPSTALVLTFDAFWVNGDWDADETARVVVSTDGIAFTEVGVLGDGAAQTGVFDVMTSTQYILDGLGGTEFYLGFDYDDAGGWNYGFAIDNVEIIELTTAKDVTLNAVNAWRFADAGGNVEATLDLTNNGYETISSIDVEVSDASGVIGTQTISDLEIAFGTDGTAAISTPYDISNSAEYNFNYTITNVNGGADENTADNSGDQNLVSVVNPPVRSWMVEELTAPGCTWCPRGAVFMDRMEAAYPDRFVGVAVHGNFGGTSPMMVQEYVQEFWDFNGQAYPTMGIDRTLGGSGIPGIDDMAAFGAAVDELFTARVAPAGVTVSAEVSDIDRILNIDASVEWRSNFTGNYALLIIVTEDHIVGDNATYSQVNAYAGGGSGPMDGYENLPNPVPFADMTYNHVLRHSPTGYYGDDTVFTGTFAVGDMSSASYTYTVPESYDLSELNVVAVVLDTDTGEAVNSTINREVSVLSSSDDYTLEGVSINVFPNPSSDVSYIQLEMEDKADVQLTLTNAFGQVVSQRTYNDLVSGTALPVVRNTLAAGNYFATITIDGKSLTKRISFID